MLLSLLPLSVFLLISLLYCSYSYSNSPHSAHVSHLSHGEVGLGSLSIIPLWELQFNNRCSQDIDFSDDWKMRNKNVRHCQQFMAMFMGKWWINILINQWIWDIWGYFQTPKSFRDLSNSVWECGPGPSWTYQKIQLGSHMKSPITDEFQSSKWPSGSRFQTTLFLRDFSWWINRARHARLQDQPPEVFQPALGGLKTCLRGN